MYKKNRNKQLAFEHFDQPLGLKLNPDNHDDGDDSGNSGTLIFDATCAPQNIEYPQDINLLNQCREDLEGIVDEICYSYNLKKPRMYRINARKEYLSLAKCKKRTGKKIRKAIKAQLQYVRRDLRYVDEFIAQGLELEQKQLDRIEVRQVYEQQDYMYCNNTHVVSGRIVSIS
jgi:hypothetical protein